MKPTKLLQFNEYRQLLDELINETKLEAGKIQEN